MPTNKQRREAERRRLQRQLERRREREVRRRRLTLITSIVGAIVIIGVVVGFLVATGNDDKKKKTAAKATTSASPSPTAASSSGSACGDQQFAKQKVTAATGATVHFDGVTVKGAADLKGKPGVTSKSTTAPAKLEYKDLVVGKGTAAKPTSCVTIQYDGVLYKNGTEFDSSWSRGTLAQFSLTSVVPGFTQGIGGTTGVPPMRVGGRRVIVLPAALGYGSQAQGKIPANAPLVFVVDLTAVSSAAAASG